MIKIATSLATGIPALVAATLAFFTRKFGVATATIATMLFLMAGMIAAINGIYTALLSTAILPEWLATGLGVFIPASFTATVSAIVSARVVGAAFDLAIGKVKAINDAS